MKKYNILSYITTLLLSVCSCDIIPAEEIIEDAGVVAFVAEFQTPANVSGKWTSGAKLIAVDSNNELNKFTMDVGEGNISAEFSGEVTPGSAVKYVAYAADVNSIVYNKKSSIFTLTIPSVYSAGETGTLLTANNAAIGILQGGSVNLNTVCAFLKFTLEPNGKTLSLSGMEFPLTDVRTVTITADDGLPIAGKINARWSEEKASVKVESIGEGHSSVTFHSCQIKDGEGNIFFRAGDYYIPIIPREYSGLKAVVEDKDGNKATALSNKTLNAQTAVTSDIHALSWPTKIIAVNFKCSSKTESETEHPEIMAWPKYNYEVDRVSETTGETKKGEAQRKTIISFTEGEMTYQVWASEGYAKYFVSGNILYDILLNNYYTGWSNSGDKWTGGSMHGYAWIKIPEYNGVLNKIELEVLSRSTGPVHLSTDVNPDTGESKGTLYTIPVTAKSAFNIETIPVDIERANIPYYLVFGDGYYYRVRSWKLYYKIYE